MTTVIDPAVKVLVHEGESILNVFQNKSKKSKMGIAITNQRIIIFDYDLTNNLIDLRDKSYSINFDRITAMNRINHLLVSDLEIITDKANFTINKLSKTDCLKLETIITTLKQKQISQKHVNNFTRSATKNVPYSLGHKHKYNQKIENHQKKHISNKKGHKLNIHYNQDEMISRKKYCSQCGKKNVLSEENCSNCGEELTTSLNEEEILLKNEKKICQYCNALLYPSDIFCSECGHKIES